jgi:hypothetical protein
VDAVVREGFLNIGAGEDVGERQFGVRDEGGEDTVAVLPVLDRRIRWHEGLPCRKSEGNQRGQGRPKQTLPG